MAKRTLVVESNVPVVKPTKQNQRDLERAVLEFNKAMRVAGLPVTLSTVEYELTDYRGRGNTVNDYQIQIEVPKLKRRTKVKTRLGNSTFETEIFSRTGNPPIHL